MRQTLWLRPIIHIHAYGVLGLGVCLAFIHLTLLNRFAYVNQFSSSFLLWVGIAGLMQQRWNGQTRGSSPVACLVGGAIFVGLLAKAAMLSDYEPSLRVWPFLSILALGLLISGWKGLGHYRPEAIAWAMLSLPPAPLLHWIDLTLLTAKLASFLLWCLGGQVLRLGTDIVLPGGTVTVLSGCSGVESILQLLGLAVLFILFFSPGCCKGGIAIGGAILLSLIANAARVALMAILNAQAAQNAFEYWHSGNGSHLFSWLTVTVFCTFCLWLMHEDQDDPESANSS